jgi:ubiquinone/menaquinone biosynthesis C-methylase UbiE
MFIPKTLRTDKTSPNFWTVANDDWLWIADPITENLLRGQSFDLVFKYHNAIKRALYQTTSASAEEEGGETLLDIGSGQGGDTAKWRNYKKIIAVEPNENYIPELRRRIQGAGLENKVLIVNTPGENYEGITEAVYGFNGGPVDCVSLMFSLTFFWESEVKLQNLARTINNNLKESGQIIFVTMDGDSVLQAFRPAIRGAELSRLMFENYIPRPGVIELLPPEKASGKDPASGISPQPVYIDLPGTIVEKQIEYLVFINDLLIILRHLSEVKNNSWELAEIHRAEQEKFLTNSELIYTKMYSYGVIQRGEKNKPPMITRKTPGTNKSPAKSSGKRIPVRKAPVSKTISKSATAQIPSKTPAPTEEEELEELEEPEEEELEELEEPEDEEELEELEEPEEEELEELEEGEPKETGVKSEGARKTTTVPVRTLLEPGKKEERRVSPREEDILSFLSVREPKKKGDPGIGDDEVQVLKAIWYTNNPVVRIATIGDGSCFFHALLKAYNKEYQENASYDFRQELVAKLRRDLAAILQLPVIDESTKVDSQTRESRRTLKYLVPADPNLPLEPTTEEYKVVYETAVNGQFPQYYQTQLSAAKEGEENPIVDAEGQPVNLDLAGLQEFFDSRRDVGQEVYGYVCDYLGLDIYVLTGYTDDLRTHYTTAEPNNPNRIPRYSIVIMGNGVHYEVIALQRPDGYQTLFEPDDEFIVALNKEIFH